MYRMVDCGTWDDPWFESLEPQGKLFFLYLLTNPRSTSCGAFEITPRKMSFETGIPQEQIETWLASWSPRVQWWPEHQIVFLKNFYRRQSNSEKVRINAAGIVAKFPDQVRKAIYTVYPEFQSPDDTLSIPHEYPTDKRNVTETEQDVTELPPLSPLGDDEKTAEPPKPKPKEARGTRIPPDWEPSPLDMGRMRVLQVTDAEMARETEKFRDYYTATGKPMKDWSAAWRNWIRKAIEIRPAHQPLRVVGNDPDPAMAAWLAVVRHKQTGNGFPVNPQTQRIVIPARILDAADAVGGVDAIDPGNNYQRKDFLAAYRAAEVAS
jgi:hypothetical protein